MNQALLGGVSTWLGDHLGIRRVVDFFLTMFVLLEKIFRYLHIIVPFLFKMCLFVDFFFMFSTTSLHVSRLLFQNGSRGL